MQKIMKLSDLKLNPNNPRTIRDDKFFKLVESVKNFPKMLELRPIVVNEDMLILGGNMRYKACQEAWITEVPVIIAENLTEEEQNEFLIKDNTSGWDWDFDLLLSNWEPSELDDWGVDWVSYFVDKDDTEELEEVWFWSVEIPNVWEKTFRGIQIPVKQEIYEECFKQFQLAISEWLDVGQIFYNAIKYENNRTK